MNTWQDLQSAVIVALVGAVPVLAVWFKVWASAKIAELQAKSDANAGRLDQHDKIQGVITSPTGAVNTTLGRTSLPEPIALSSDVLHETPDRVIDNTHAVAGAVIEAQPGLPKP